MSEFEIGARVYIDWTKLDTDDFTDEFLDWELKNRPVLGEIIEDRSSTEEKIWRVKFDKKLEAPGKEVPADNAGDFFEREMIIDHPVVFEEIVAETDALLAREKPVEEEASDEVVPAIYIIAAKELNGTHIGQIVTVDTSEGEDVGTFTSSVRGVLKCIHHLKNGDTPYVAVTVAGSCWELDLNLKFDEQVGI